MQAINRAWEEIKQPQSARASIRFATYNVEWFHKLFSTTTARCARGVDNLAVGHSA
jgi:hypothetical protein